MRMRYVVDTNVLIAASAADPVSPKDIDATPSDPNMRMRVWQWLNDFQVGSSRLVLDCAGCIYDEYNNKLGFNDFGIQVVMYKWSTAAVDSVNVQYDQDGHGVLAPSPAAAIHDNAERKMVAAALDAYRLYQECGIAFAGDTDWHDWENDLQSLRLLIEPIVEDWSRAKHAEKAVR